jgi:voltage-gated potassium channel
MRTGIFWNFIIAWLILMFLSGLSIMAYMIVEEWSFIDALYMVVITLSTVGYMEVNPLSPAGRIITLSVIIIGVGTFVYVAGEAAQLIVEGKLQFFLGRRRILNRIKSLKGHFIICGFGRIGSVVAEEIRREGYPVVVVERNPDMIEQIEAQGFLYVEGDATSDDVLIDAGLENAKHLVSALNQEASNVYVTLTARQLNPEVHIVARADTDSHISRLERAGADRVVTPNLIGGVRMAQTVLRPSVTNFLDLAMRGASMDLQMEELVVNAYSPLNGKNIRESNIRPDYNVIIITIKKEGGEMIFNPGPQAVISSGDTLITVGSSESMRQLRSVLTGES